MGIGAALGGLGSLFGIGSSIANIANSGSSPTSTQGGNPARYIPTAQPGADTNYQSLMSAQIPGALSLPGQVLPGLQQYTSNLQNNPFAQQQLQGAQQVGMMGPGVAGQQFQGAGALQSLGGQTAGVAPQLIGAAFDPQQALYQRTLQQETDQQNAQAAMSGVAGTPYGAGLANQGIANFNIDWQNNQLQRMLSGAQGLGALDTAAGRAYSGASDLGTGGLGTLLSSSGSPYTTYAGQQGNNIAALQSLISGSSAIPGTGAYGNISSAYSPIQAYLGLGQGASAGALQGQMAGFNQNQILGQQLANSLTNPNLATSLNSIFGSNPSYSGPADPGSGMANWASVDTSQQYGY